MAGRCLLYYITDRSQFAGDETTRRRTLLAKIAEAARAGVDYVQLREKDLTTRDLEALARETIRMIREQLRLGTGDRQPATGLLINSRTDIALAAGADGVHLRSEDIAVSEVRSVWTEVLALSSQPVPRTPRVALSCHSSAEVFHAADVGADFAVFAPVFEKRDSAHTPAGLAALREACRASIPVLALGGVTLANAKACLDAGAAGVAAIRLFQENCVEDVVRALRQI
jgi:thiamine-phosphate pyrophosphorylase